MMTNNKHRRFALGEELTRDLERAKAGSHYKNLRNAGILEEQRKGLDMLSRIRFFGHQWIKDRARQVWDKDYREELRIGAVAIEVQKLILDFQKEQDIVRYWPKSVDAIKKIIRPEAPDYAKKGGRPRKN